MKIHRFIGEFNLTAKQIEISDNELVHQLNRVLRVKAGDKIILCDGRGNEALVNIDEINKQRVSASVIERSQNPNEADRCVILYCSIIKRENFDLVVQKATELGIAEIYPMISKRTVKTNVKTERLQRIVKEAAEQSGRGVLPILHDPIFLSDAIDQAQTNDLNLLFDLNAPKFSSDLIQDKGKVGLFIGPEGGWDQSEVELAKKFDMQFANLGKLTLRAETAALVGSYLALQ